MDKTTTLTQSEWSKRGEALFGHDRMLWRFVCPSCGYAAIADDWRAAGAKEGEVAFSCVGRRLQNPIEAFPKEKGNGPCTYAGGGLFQINPIEVQLDDGHSVRLFAFDEPVEIIEPGGEDGA